MGTEHLTPEEMQGGPVTAPREPLNKQEVLHDRKYYWLVKRIQDIILSIAALIILCIPMLVLALIIYIDDPHASPIFVQTRVGRHGREFKFYKFRSMYADAESRLSELLDRNEMDGPAFKLTDDPRITRIGKFIRKSSIDELPQLWNVLKGDMTLVGPRPALPREVAQYDDWLKERLYVTPGLTCYWQIQPDRNDMSFAQWMELDIKYIKERTFLGDWVIMLKTVGAILGMHGK